MNKNYYLNKQNIDESGNKKYWFRSSPFGCERFLQNGFVSSLLFEQKIIRINFCFQQQNNNIIIECNKTTKQHKKWAASSQHSIALGKTLEEATLTLASPLEEATLTLASPLEKATLTLASPQALSRTSRSVDSISSSCTVVTSPFLCFPFTLSLGRLDIKVAFK